jgi:hypothetical protein
MCNMVDKLRSWKITICVTWLSRLPHSSRTWYFITNARFFNSFLFSWCVWMPYTFPCFEKYLIIFFCLICNSNFWQRNSKHIGGLWFNKCLLYRDKLPATLVVARVNYCAGKMGGRFQLSKGVQHQKNGDGRKRNGGICEFESDFFPFEPSFT